MNLRTERYCYTIWPHCHVKHEGIVPNLVRFLNRHCKWAYSGSCWNSQATRKLSQHNLHLHVTYTKWNWGQLEISQLGVEIFEQGFPWFFSFFGGSLSILVSFKSSPFSFLRHSFILLYICMCVLQIPYLPKYENCLLIHHLKYRGGWGVGVTL